MGAPAALYFRLGCASAFLAVCIGAFGAHALESTLASTNMTKVYETGVAYQFYHVPPQLAVAWLLTLRGAGEHAGALRAAGGLFVLGTLLFSGSLYALALSGIKPLGIVTPFGGLCLLGGWLLLMWRGSTVVARHDAVGAASSNSSLLAVQQ